MLLACDRLSLEDAVMTGGSTAMHRVHVRNVCSVSTLYNSQLQQWLS